jgi:aspartate carbamoyltransferase catalytic subunit
MTIEEVKGRADGLNILIVGDIAHSRVARSNIYALKTMGANVAVCGPNTLMPPQIEKMNIKVYDKIEKAISKDLDVIMMLRIQMERQDGFQIPSLKEYSKFWGLHQHLLEKCKEGVTVMHPGPINRGVELSSNVADAPNSVILAQVTNGVAVRMAILHHCIKGGSIERYMV